MAMYDNLLANVPTDLWIGGQWKKSSDGGRFDVVSLGFVLALWSGSRALNVFIEHSTVDQRSTL